MPQKKSSLRDIRKDLRVIYEGHNGSVPDMTRLNARKKSGFRRFLIKSILFLFVLSALAWTGFFVFSKGLFQKHDTLSVNIEGPTNVHAGSPVSYAIHYENTGTVPLASLDLSVSFPPGFHLASAIPQANDKNTWTIGALTPKSDGVITVNGMFLSEVPSSERIQALFNYKPANFNSTFQQIETAKVDITDSIFTFTMKGPEKALPGDEVQYVMTTGQSEKNPAFNLRITPNLPANFTVTSTDPAFETGQTYWNLAEIDPNQPKSFSIKGKFTSSATGAQTMTASVGFMQDDVFLKQKDANVATDLQGGTVGFHLIVNGSDKDQTIDAGKTIRGSIDYANQGTDTINDVGFAISINGNGKTLPIDWLQADLRNAKRNGNELDWNSDTTSNLKELKPNDNGIIDFSLPLLTYDDTSADHITIKLVTTINKPADGSAPRIIESNPITLSVSSSVGFNAEARYFDEEGQALGTGPLPPRVGQTTSARVFWKITNSIHDLSGIKITATLPKHVKWVDKKLTDIGTINYTANTRTVTWSIDKLPKSIPKAGAWFDVSITPKSADISTFITLIDSANFTAKDTKTNADITNTAPELTTELPNDSFASGKGAVKK